MTCFSMPCPVCGEDVDDIEGIYTECHGTERFWGAPVSVDDSEFEVDRIPECATCGKVTITADQAADHFWDRVAAYV